MDAQQVLAPGATSNSSSAYTHMGHIFTGSPLGNARGIGASIPAFVLLGSAWLPHSTLVQSIWQRNKSIKWLDKCPKSIA